MGSAAQIEDTHVGRSTLTEQLEAAPQWEDIDPAEYAELEQEEVEAEDSDVVARLDAPEQSANADDADTDDDDEVEAAPAMPSDAVELRSAQDDDVADEPVARAAAAGKKQPGPHDKPFERAVQHASGHDAKRDRYNDPDVVSNRVGRVKRGDKLVKNPHQIGRPGLRVHGKDEFHLRGEFAYRYQIVNGSKAVACDKIWEKELQHGFEKTGQRLALNPARPRLLVIEGELVWCVMSWAGGQSAAWIAIRDLRGKFADIKNTASKKAKAWNPKDVGRKKRDSAVEMKFRPVGDSVASSDKSKDDHRYIVPGQKSKDGNEVGDYLAKDVMRRNRPGGKAASQSKKLEAKHGGALEIEGGMRDLISITGNLPHDKTPPVAIDVARPGIDSFFVPKGKTFRREISLYKRHAKKSTLRQTWVFGFVGRDEGNHKVADKDRRGWVPLRVLTRP